MIKLSNMSFTKNLCKYGKLFVSDSIDDVLYSKNIITTIVFNLLKGLVTFIFLIPFILVLAAFSGCVSLKTINITKNVERIAYNTFVKSPNVSIIYEGSLEEWIIVSGNIDYREIIFENEN
jgi:hypothetical protein